MASCGCVVHDAACGEWRQAAQTSAKGRLSGVKDPTNWVITRLIVEAPKGTIVCHHQQPRTLRLLIWLLSWLPSLVVTDAEMTGRATPHARPSAALDGTNT